MVSYNKVVEMKCNNFKAPKFINNLFQTIHPNLFHFFRNCSKSFFGSQSVHIIDSLYRVIYLKILSCEQQLKLFLNKSRAILER